MHERPGDADALFLSAREARRVRAFLAFEAGQGDDFGDPLMNSGFWRAGYDERERNVVPRRLGRQQIEMLEHHSNAPSERNQPGVVERSDVLSLDEHSAAGRRFQAVDRPQKARLAGAASADDPEYRPALYRKINAMQGVNRPRGRGIDLPDMVEGDR